MTVRKQGLIKNILQTYRMYAPSISMTHGGLCFRPITIGLIISVTDGTSISNLSKRTLRKFSNSKKKYQVQDGEMTFYDIRVRNYTENSTVGHP